ncbi:amidophosphoribosyltransferase [candidate division KSB1 bacterium]|nr:amidophosphoribosyltransferase [candidate division KSB1 bacterium]
MNQRQCGLARDDKPHEKCAVMGVYGTPNAARYAYYGLYALQHRGQESSGIVSCEDKRFYKHIDMGLVPDVFSNPKDLERLKGNCAVGHNRYSTTGQTHLVNAQPLVVSSYIGPMAIAHNGNFVNSGELRNQLEKQGSLFQTTTDTEIVLHLITKSKHEKIIDKIKDAFATVKGAYSIVLLIDGKLYAVRDPNGVRPLCIGKKGETTIVASESCALDIIEAEYLRQVEPGEIIEIDDQGIHSYRLDETAERSACIFEFIYFSRPDSRIFGEKVDKARRRLGKALAVEGEVEADIVISVPDSSNTAALGYAQASGIKFEIGLIRNHYIGRTFIHPDQSMRDFNVRIKFNTVKGVLKDKRVILVEDSIVRGTTLRKLARLIRDAGAKEIHVRVSSPPIRFPCFYGMDFPTKEELIADKLDVDQIRDYLGVDSLKYLSIDGLLNSVPHERGGYCTACFSGKYPIKFDDQFKKFQLDNGIVTE